MYVNQETGQLMTLKAYWWTKRFAESLIEQGIGEEVEEGHRINRELTAYKRQEDKDANKD